MEAGEAGPAKKIDLKALLDKVPCFDGLPRKPPVNNHRADQGRPLDKQVRAWQQTLLHMLRLLTKVHLQSSGMDPEVRLLHAQGWQVLAELYHKLLEYRRECSVPGVASAQERGPLQPGRPQYGEVSGQHQSNERVKAVYVRR